jgi:toxin ParE1/3/4
MVRRIIYSAKSKSDLREIFEFISADSKLFAKRQILLIRMHIRNLKKFPNLGRIVPEMNLEYVREIIEGNYRIIYMLATENQINILTIHHTSKELKIVEFL